MATTNEILQDAGIEHAVDIARVQEAAGRDLTALLRRSHDELLGKLTDRLENIAQRGPGSWRNKRLVAMLAALHESSGQGWAEGQAALTEALRTLAELEGLWTQETLGTAIPPEILAATKTTLVRPTRQQLQAIAGTPVFGGEKLSAWFKRLSDQERATLDRQIRLGMIQGETLEQIIRRIRGTRAGGFRDGVLPQSRKRAEGLARTAVNTVSAQAREMTYLGNQDLIKGVEWLSTLDSRTSRICISLDGRIFPVNKGPRPPAHPRCRSSTSPALKSWRELGIDIDDLPPATRASMDGQVSEKLTYGDWLKTKPATFQDEVLGKGVADLWRSGNIKTDDLVNSRLRPLTLEELRAKAGVAAG